MGERTVLLEDEGGSDGVARIADTIAPRTAEDGSPVL
jgi:hypothetical protein